MRIALGILSVGALICWHGNGAYARSCPADATRASYSLWPGGAIKSGATASAKHPCGRNIQCSGGSSVGSKTRSCKWL